MFHKTHQRLSAALNRSGGRFAIIFVDIILTRLEVRALRVSSFPGIRQMTMGIPFGSALNPFNIACDYKSEALSTDSAPPSHVRYKHLQALASPDPLRWTPSTSPTKTQQNQYPLVKCVGKTPNVTTEKPILLGISLPLLRRTRGSTR